MTQETSLLAYMDLLPHVGRCQQTILSVIEKANPSYGITNLEIASYLKWPINSVTPRVKELRQMGLVYCARKRRSGIHGRKCMAWLRVNPEGIAL